MVGSVADVGVNPWAVVKEKLDDNSLPQPVALAPPPTFDSSIVGTDEDVPLTI